jgi:hypothetical protein
MGRPLYRPEPVFVEMQPPRPRFERPMPRPSPGHVWIGGYWGWENGVHVWIGGEWVVPPSPGYVWVQPRWARHGHRWQYVPGYWNHRSGPVFMVNEPVVAEQPLPVYGSLSISGYVTSVQGAPVAGIMVTLAGSREGHIVTDSSGYYIFADLPPGSYAIRPTGDCAFSPDVVNLNNLGASFTQNIIVSGCGGW